MSDGPFKNSKLGKRWKKFAEAVQNDAFSSAECCTFASEALVREIVTDEFSSLMANLLSYVNQSQLDFDSLASIESIFNDHIGSPFVDKLQKEIRYHLSKQIALTEAVRQSVEASVKDQASEARNRIEEECIRLRETGKMRQDQFDQTVIQSSAIFDSLPQNKICEALLTRNKNAFKETVSKKDGLDEGPSL